MNIIVAGGGAAVAGYEQPQPRPPRSLAGKPLAGFRATPSRRITVLYGIIVYVIRCKNPLLHRLSMLRKMTAWMESGFPSEFLAVHHHWNNDLG